ncbi:hypothetical protein IE53DRAFT_295392, partial [Violaceomyces palustris]
SQPVDSSWLTIHLLAITFATGLLDATTYADFGLFASNQTGNTVVFFVLLLKLELRSNKSPSLLLTAISLVCFLFFGFVFGRLGIFFGHRKRGWLVLSMFSQSVLLSLPAILLSSGAIQLRPPGLPSIISDDAILILLLASSAGVQVSMAKCSGINEIPTAMLTSPFIDLLTDPLLFANPMRTSEAKVRSRNIRFVYIVMLILGAVIGSLIHRFGGGTKSVLY